MATSLFTSDAKAALVQSAQANARIEQRRVAGPWLHAWNDPVANVKAFSESLRLAELAPDGDYRLIIADMDRKLKVYKGTTLQSEQGLLDVPSAIASFYPDNTRPQTPSLAVAAGTFIYIYRNLRPYYKFTLPAVELSAQEKELWEHLKNGTTEPVAAAGALMALRDQGVKLSSRSLDLLSIQDSKQQLEFVTVHRSLPFYQLTVATCMETLYKSIEAERGVGMLVVGTESAQILILHALGSHVLKQVSLPSTPCFLAVSGTLDVEYRIMCACRNGHIYSIKNGTLVGSSIELETASSAMCFVDKSLMVACMNRTIRSYHVKGKCNYTVFLPANVVNMCALSLKRTRVAHAFVVALANGEIRTYNQKHLLHSFQTDDAVTGLRVGPYGREECALIYCGKSGSLTIKILSRQAVLDASSANPGPPPEQDVPINIPRKTKLYLEQLEREKSRSLDMHRIFQRDLCKLRLSAARAYVKVITAGAGPLSTSKNSSLRLEAQLNGLGPYFKLRVSLKNTGVKPLVNVPVTISFNRSLYTVVDCQIPVLIPGVDKHTDVTVYDFQCAGAADPVRVVVCNPQSCIPPISALVNMPICDPR